MQRYTKAILFVGLTFLVSWTYLLIYFQQGGKLIYSTDDLQGSLTTLAVLAGLMFIPALVALVVQKGIYREPVLGPLGIRFRLNWWWLVAWLLPVLIALAAQAAAIFLIPNVAYSPEMAGFFARIMPREVTPELLQMRDQLLAYPPVVRVLLMLPSILIAGVTINALAAFGEELGWRGLLQRELAPLGFWRYSLLIGAIWGLWHAPLIIRGYNYPDHPQLGVLMMILFTILYTPLLCYVRLRAQSVLAAAVMHGTINASAGLALLFVFGGTDLTVGIMGFAGFIVLAGLNCALFFIDPALVKSKSLE